VSSGATTGNFVGIRTNLGFFNSTGAPVTVMLNLGNAGGTSVSTRTLTLAPYQWMQMPLAGSTGAFSNFNSSLNTGTVTYQASAPIFAYVTNVESVTGDTTFLMAEEDQQATPISEADIAGIVQTANQGEVQVNTLGVSRATNGTVKTFAQQMVTEHTAALQMAQTAFTQAGVTPAQNPTTAFLQTMTQQTQTSLGATATGTAFDRAFMQSQVTMHQMVLNMIDSVLLPSAQSASIRNLLHTQRNQIAAHLQEAQQILAGL
jgi:putative membrane protein